jgi:hypothetical protein
MKTAKKTDMEMLRAARPDLTNWAAQALDDKERRLLLERIMAASAGAMTTEATASDQMVIKHSNTPAANRSRMRRWLAPAIAAACVPALLAIALVGGRALLSNNSHHNAGNVGEGPAPCNSSDLVARRYYTQGQLSGATANDQWQNDIYRFTLTNIGDRLCVLAGYPTSFRASGNVLGKNYPNQVDKALTITIQRGVPSHFGIPVRDIKLNPGGSAYFGFTRLRYSSTQKTRDVVELTGVTVPGDSRVIPLQRSPADGAKNVPYRVTMIGATRNTISVTPFTRTLP